MFRSELRPYAALLLLLCFGRTLLPEAWVLAWHPHQHTTAEPAHQRKAVATGRHQHCHAEQFYTVPFVPAGCPVLPQPRVGRVYQRLAAGQACGCPRPPRQLATLRGPPA